MIIYNITSKVDWSIAEDWERWMKEVYIPEMMETGCFESHRFVKLLQTDEVEGPTYAVQYYASLLSNYDEYLLDHAPGFRKKIAGLWREKYIDFHTLMQVIG